jgi:hypothetical protein
MTAHPPRRSLIAGQGARLSFIRSLIAASASSIPPPPVDGDQHWGERVGFKGPSTPSDNSLPLRRRETGIPDGSKIVCIAMAATTFVARSA